MSNTSHALQHLLSQIVPSDKLTPELCASIQQAAMAGQSADVDIERAARCGFPEVIYGEGKPAELVVDIIHQQQQAGQPSLVTRVQPDVARVILNEFGEARHNPIARTVSVAPPVSDVSPAADTHGYVCVVTAGSCDRPVAEEAIDTLKWMQVACRLIQDVGVAGPHRLPKHVDELRTADAVVCVAGMEAALPSVLGGHVSCPVIGVPTSVGYGASLGGLTALMSMLTCCASNVTVVNIDAGFKGGYLAGIIASRVAAARQQPGPQT